ncbi:histidine triad nucleotide-binding protein [Marinicella sp. S1101]|uniref:histidine triad nucleotide-binding protein n=1 Tax=Marinicella marina TaxID=2996016 RepID=UPI002260833A|nr:histidine triad nucleotide-binding protein [Marinicella marina]MCX7554989.1 histidine triad nucleotide-binding protein [Marinicella marina]MDJ1141347.1 histidine triad nucleotide-binding protein [Marinicella marina]
MEPTIFDLILSKEIPADVVYEDDFVMGFKDVNPQAPVHVLFIPKVQIKTHNDLNADNMDYVSKIHLAINAYAKQIGVAEDGYRIVMNCNGQGGQTVFHIHMHFLAGRQMQWPPG